MLLQRCGSGWRRALLVVHMPIRLLVKPSGARVVPEPKECAKRPIWQETGGACSNPLAYSRG